MWYMNIKLDIHLVMFVYIRIVGEKYMF